MVMNSAPTGLPMPRSPARSWPTAARWMSPVSTTTLGTSVSARCCKMRARCDRITVPLVVVEHRAVQRRIGQNDLIADHVPSRRRRGKRVEQPGLLLVAQHRPRRIERPRHTADRGSASRRRRPGRCGTGDRRARPDRSGHPTAHRGRCDTPCRGQPAGRAGPAGAPTTPGTPRSGESGNVGASAAACGVRPA